MANVSVIFPMYNVSNYVEDSIKSVLQQTYRDYEVIAVNDGSTDSTVEVFNDAVKSFNQGVNVKLINKKNGGLADARNAALELATGNWIVFVDSDDVIHPRYLEILISDAERFSTDLSIATYKMVDSESLFEFDDVVSGKAVSKSRIMKLLLHRNRFRTGCWCLLIKRELIEKNGLRFNTDVRFSVDQAFIWKVIDVATSISMNYSRVYNYYLRPGSIMTSTKKESIYSGLEHFTNVVSSLNNLPFDSSILINRWKLGILHSTAKLTGFEDYYEVKQKLNFSYFEALRIPLLKTRIILLIGIVSDKLLYKVFANH